jgi:tetratricopeptide (TPR) repeat protein
MSLLLDALKRAEEAKRAKLSAESGRDAPDAAALSTAAQGAAPELPAGDGPLTAKPEAPEFRLEDYKEVIPAKAKDRYQVAKSTTRDALRGAELSLENIADARIVEGAEEESTAASVPTATPVPQSALDSTRIEAAQSRDTARNIFAAKHPANADEGARKKWLLPVIAVGLLAVGGGGWYVWNEVNRVTRPVGASIAARPALPPPAAGQPGARQKVEAASRSEAQVEPPLSPLLPPPAEQASSQQPAVRAPASAGAPLSERAALAKSLKDAPVSKETPIGLMLARSNETPAVSADLVDAYAALVKSDYPRARTLYARLVLADPLNADAQLGMATALARSGDPSAATRHYRQVLVIDPRNGAALAGLLAVSDARSPSLEVELRTLLGRNPDTASLHFTLGNLYASERRWVEAQQAYFEAYRLEPGNADFTYNLAVSLDQLKKPKLALDHYQKALETRPKAGGQFDPSAVTRRIKALTADSGNN